MGEENRREKLQSCSQTTESESTDQFDKLFSRISKFTSKGHSIVKFEVRESEKFPHLTMETALTLFDGTVMTGCIPAIIEPGDEGFVRSYSGRIIAPVIIGHAPTNQVLIDDILSQILSEVSKDNISHKMKKLAKNVNWATSVAFCKAGAYANNMATHKYVRKLLRTYDPEFKDRRDCDIPNCVFSITESAITSAQQHLLILPQPGLSIHEAINRCKKIYDNYLKCRELHGHDKVNDDEECSYTPNIQDIKKGFEELTKIIDHLGYKDKVSIGLNGGASQFHDGNDSYRFHSKKEQDNDTHLISAKALNDFYVSLLKEYDLQYIEDAFHRSDWDYSSRLNTARGIVTVTGDKWELIHGYMKGNYRKVCTSILLKVSKTGSVSELIEFVVLNYIYLVVNVMDSHSCESYDTFIADLCIGLMVDSMKIGLSCITGDCRVCNQVDNIFINMENISCRGFVNGRPDLVITGGEELDDWDEPIRHDDYDDY